MNTEYSRLILKRSSQSGATPTIPASGATLNDFIDTDLYNGEMFLNITDGRAFFRGNDDIYEFNLGTGGTPTETFWSAGTGTNAIAIKNFGAQNTGGLNSINAGTGAQTSGNFSNVFGGRLNNASGYGGTIVGGGYNTSSGYNSAIISGAYNTVDGGSSSIISGVGNVVDGDVSIIGAGTYNTINSNTEYSAIIGGSGNTVSNGVGQAVIGGQGNIVAGEGSTHSAVVGGFDNENKAKYSVILGGQNNEIENGRLNVVILGGTGITADTDNTAFVPNLNISSVSSGTSNYEILVRDITTGSVKVIDSSSVAGTTVNRPSSPSLGFEYFDTTLGYPIWYNGSIWVNASGNPE